ncbi:MAG TPA: carboxylesterase family protein [Thermoanaerobaculia bacterium]|nr:carboxylesterase family protein [Thermoanaerobaculia bacterium]
MGAANIEAFGGDRGNVLIFGESGGGTKTLSLLSSPLASGLFHKAIIESGSALISAERATTLESAEATGERIAAELGVQDGAGVLAALRAASWEDVIAAASDQEIGFRANLTVDGWALPESVHAIFEQGRQHDVPLIVGANAGERGELQENVPLLASLHSRTTPSKTWVYNFSHMPTGWRNEPCVAFHGVEIPYVFGAIPEGLTVPTILFLSRGGGCTSSDPGADELDHEVAENTMRLWTEFARTGDPSVEDLIEWPPYTEADPRYLDIGSTLEVGTGIENAYVAPPEREG